MKVAMQYYFGSYPQLCATQRVPLFKAMDSLAYASAFSLHKISCAAQFPVAGCNLFSTEVHDDSQ